MSLVKADYRPMIYKQYIFKLKAYKDAVTTLMIIQIAAILLSLGGTESMGGGSSVGISMTVNYFSSDFVIALTWIWAFTTGSSLTSKQNRKIDFIFAANRFTSSAANILYLLTVGLFASITSVLAGSAILVIRSIFSSNDLLITEYSYSLFAVSILYNYLYVILIFSLGYFIGASVQKTRWSFILLPFLLAAYMYMFLPSNPSVFEFFFLEESQLLFLIKVLAVSFILFSSSTVLLHTKEVK